MGIEALSPPTKPARNGGLKSVASADNPMITPRSYEEAFVPPRISPLTIAGILYCFHLFLCKDLCNVSMQDKQYCFDKAVSIAM